MKVELLSITPNAEKLIERATRICYNSEDKITEDSYKTFLPNCLKRGHVSILRHSMMTVKISEVSRAFLAQMTRHVFLSYLVRSQRYNVEDFKFIVPPNIQAKSQTEIENNEENTVFDLLEDAAYNGWFDYKLLLQRGIKPEDARFCLTNACPTEMVVSGNLNAWWNFIKLRLRKSVQWEICSVAKEIYTILNKHCPYIFTKELLEYQVEIKLEIEDEKIHTNRS